MCAQNSLYTNPKPCKHLADYKLTHGFNGYDSFQNCLKPTPTGRTRVDKHNTQIPRCSFCNGYQGRFYICLTCSSIWCSSHILFHTQSEKGHELAIDMERSELYCCLCCDQVYDPDFDKVVVSKQVKDLPWVNKSNGFEGFFERSSKRKRLDQGIGLDLKKSKLLISMRDRRAKSCYPLGLRGLNNLGSTCFMNSVLQALIHAPPLRNYFLSDRHNSVQCKKRSGEKICLLCDIDAVSSAMFSGERTPYSPAQFLYSWWLHSSNLASYEEQDAHEFFISVLDGIHEKESKIRNSSKDDGDCQCIAHRAFSGLLRSDVTCISCGFTSTTYDPCVDISLNLDTSSLSSSSNVANKPVKPDEKTSVSTLSGCLNAFTKAERLGPDQKLHCQNCRELRDSSKQLSIKRLPLVMCLHIKRVEHSLVKRMSKKIDQYLQFPFSLDMTPYLSSSIVRSKFGNRILAFEYDNSDSSAEYEIFAVIAHSGMLESGHYVTYLRLKDQWYKCDDAWIYEVDEGTVRASQCYMLFYVEKLIYYKTNEDLSCVRISPRRDPCVSTAGCS